MPNYAFNHVHHETKDVDATLAAIEANDVSIWVGPLSLEDGQRILFINGPDHIKIELMETV